MLNRSHPGTSGTHDATHLLASTSYDSQVDNGSDGATTFWRRHVHVRGPGSADGHQIPTAHRPPLPPPSRPDTASTTDTDSVGDAETAETASESGASAKRPPPLRRAAVDRIDSQSPPARMGGFSRVQLCEDCKQLLQCAESMFQPHAGCTCASCRARKSREQLIEAVSMMRQMSTERGGGSTGTGIGDGSARGCSAGGDVGEGMGTGDGGGGSTGDGGADDSSAEISPTRVRLERSPRGGSASIEQELVWLSNGRRGEGWGWG